jgi:hypothetical protein
MVDPNVVKVILIITVLVACVIFVIEDNNKPHDSTFLGDEVRPN